MVPYQLETGYFKALTLWLTSGKRHRLPVSCKHYRLQVSCKR
jgi:hypothetical protein